MKYLLYSASQEELQLEDKLETSNRSAILCLVIRVCDHNLIRLIDKLYH